MTKLSIRRMWPMYADIMFSGGRGPVARGPLQNHKLLWRLLIRPLGVPGRIDGKARVPQTA